MRRRFGLFAPAKAEPVSPNGLVPAERVLQQWRADGAGRGPALAWTRRQLEGLAVEVDDDDRWSRLRELVRRAGDPWNADDWPLGFDPLVCCIALCTDLDFECARCPVGQTQDGRSCAHPQSAFGTIGELIRDGDRDGLRRHISELRERLSTMA